MATIRDVAQRAGVSAASVSRVLKNDSTFSVSQKTKGKNPGSSRRAGIQSGVLNTLPFREQEVPLVSCFCTVRKRKWRTVLPGDPYEH